MAFFDDNIDLTQHELRSAVLQNATVDPSLPLEGQVYHKTGSTHRPQIFDGTVFKQFLLVGDVTSNTGDVTQGSNSGSSGRLKISAGADKSISDYAAGAGIVKVDAVGVVSTASAGADYLTASSTNALTNKTLDAAGTGNTISNLGTANFAGVAVNSSTSLTSATNTQFPTALAVKSYADGLLAANDALILKGAIDASTNPNFPAADAGWVYKISVAGLIGGASGIAVEVNDVITCYVDGSVAGTAAGVGANWVVSQTNLQQATTSATGFTRYATNAESLAKTVTNAAVTPSALVGFTQTKAFTFGDGTATSFTLTHNLGTKNVLVQVRDSSTDEIRFPKIVNSTTNTVTVSGYIVAPTINQFSVVVQG